MGPSQTGRGCLPSNGARHTVIRGQKERRRGEESEEGKAEDFEKGKEQADISMDTM